MKIRCQKQDLITAMNIALRAVSAKSSMNILECFLFNVKDNEISIISNNMEIGIETKVVGTVFDGGMVAVNAKMISDIVRKLPDNDVTIETDASNSIKITCEKARFNLAGQGGEDFPALPEIPKNDAVVMSQFTLRELIRQTVFSISDNDSNKIMTGELFEIKGDRLRLSALDGHRISIRKISLKKEYPDRQVIIPGKTLNEISKILSGELADEVSIFFEKNNILFEFNDTVVLSRLIEGKYYNVDQMIRPDYETKIRINKRELLSCIERAILLAKESDKMPIVVGITDDNIELKMTTSLGSMREEISIRKEGKDLLIGFNPKYFIEALRVIDAEEIDIYLINAKAPCFIKDAEDSYVYLILPVNINGASI